MAQVRAYLKFNGNCQEAFSFYQAALGGEISIQTVAQSPMAAQMPAEIQDKVLHASLATEEILIMGSDMAGPEGITVGNNVTLALICKSKEETEACFKKLSEGGIVSHPLKEEFFGTYGDLTDKYGVNWIVQFAPVQQ